MFTVLQGLFLTIERKIKMATDIGIDLGSSKTVIFSSSKVVLELPNVVTVAAESWEAVYFGEKAKQTIGRTPDSLLSVYPIEHGVIADYDLAELMLKNYMSQVFGNKILRPRIMATLPAGLTELQHRSLANVVESAGGRNITVIEGIDLVPHDTSLFSDKFLHPNDKGFDYYVNNLYKKLKELI